MPKAQLWLVAGRNLLRLRGAGVNRHWIPAKTIRFHPASIQSKLCLSVFSVCCLVLLGKKVGMNACPNETCVQHWNLLVVEPQRTSQLELKVNLGFCGNTEKLPTNTHADQGKLGPDNMYHLAVGMQPNWRFQEWVFLPLSVVSSRVFFRGYIFLNNNHKTSNLLSTSHNIENPAKCNTCQPPQQKISENASPICLFSLPGNMLMDRNLEIAIILWMDHAFYIHRWDQAWQNNDSILLTSASKVKSSRQQKVCQHQNFHISSVLTRWFSHKNVVSCLHTFAMLVFGDFVWNGVKAGGQFHSDIYFTWIVFNSLDRYFAGRMKYSVLTIISALMVISLQRSEDPLLPVGVWVETMSSYCGSALLKLQSFTGLHPLSGFSFPKKKRNQDCVFHAEVSPCRLSFPAQDLLKNTGGAWKWTTRTRSQGQRRQQEEGMPPNRSVSWWSYSWHLVPMFRVFFAFRVLWKFPSILFFSHEVRGSWKARVWFPEDFHQLFLLMTETFLWKISFSQM